jgi:hypothetical protein
MDSFHPSSSYLKTHFSDLPTFLCHRMRPSRWIGITMTLWVSKAESLYTMKLMELNSNHVNCSLKQGVCSAWSV